MKQVLCSVIVFLLPLVGVMGQMTDVEVVALETFESASPIYSDQVPTKTTITDLDGVVAWQYNGALATNAVAAKYYPMSGSNYLRLRAYGTTDGKCGNSWIQTVDKIADLYCVKAYICAENHAARYNFEYSTDGIFWQKMIQSEANSALLGVPSPTLYGECADTTLTRQNAYVRIRFQNVNTSSYWVNIDDITIYSRHDATTRSDCVNPVLDSHRQVTKVYKDGQLMIYQDGRYFDLLGKPVD